MRTALSAALAGLMLLAGQAAARQDKGPRNDTEYLIKAIAVESAEVTLADVAAKNAANEDVRKFAKKLSDEHTKSRDALMARAKDLKVGIVAGLTKDHQAQVARLRLMRGSELDKAYLKHVVDSHTTSEKMYEKWSGSAKDAELKKLAEKYQTTAKDHLKKAKELQKQLEG